MLSRWRNQLAVPLITALGGCLFLAGCTIPPNPSGIYMASLRLTDPLAKELVPTRHLACLSNKSGIDFSVEFIERDDREAQEQMTRIPFETQIQELELVADLMLAGSTRKHALDWLDYLKSRLPAFNVSKEPQRDVKNVRYSAVDRYASEDPVGDARLLKDYADAEEMYEKSWKGDWPQKEVYHARSLEAYQRLSQIVFGMSESGVGTAEVFLKGRKVVCDLDIYRQSAEPLPPGMVCSLPVPMQVRIELRIEQNGDLVLESKTGEYGPPIGLRFTKSGS
jgi:hypothetical protein